MANDRSDLDTRRTKMLRIEPLSVALRLVELLVAPTRSLSRLLGSLLERLSDGVLTFGCSANDSADDEEVARKGVAFAAFLSGLVDECYEAVTLGV